MAGRLLFAAASAAVARGFLARSLCVSAPLRLARQPLSMSAAAAGKKVLVPIADGSEEIEACTIINTLVRGGVSVTVASIADGLQVTGSRGIKLVADCPIRACEGEDWDMVVCPGGMPGATYLKESEPLANILKKQNAASKLVGAICAAPAVVLAAHGILDGKRATCYPAPKFVSAVGSGHVADELVVQDGNVFTSQGPATALPFALRLVAELCGQPKAQEVADQMLYKGTF